MFLGYRRRWVGPFALAWLALCCTVGWGPMRMRPSAETIAEPSFVSVVVPAPSSAVGDVPAPRPSLSLVSVNGGETEVLFPQRDDGGFSDEDLPAPPWCSHSSRRARSTRSLRVCSTSSIAPCGTSTRQVVHVVSGYRRDRAGSRHTQGRAVDMMIDGVSNDQLAAYLRGLGFVGVGFYPRAGFVHLDVRDASYFWVDDSAPGAPNHLVQVREEEARAADAAARERGEIPDLYVPNNRAEDRAAAKVYAQRARARRAAAHSERAATPSSSE